MYAWDAAELLGVLANERRLRVLSLLAARGEAGMSLERIAARAGLSERSTKRIIDRLAHSNLARARESRKGIIYVANNERLGELLGFLSRRLKPRSAASQPATQKSGGYRSLRAKLGQTAPPLRVADIAAAIEARAA